MVSPHRAEEQQQQQNVTFDEENPRKSFNGLSLDELLKNVISVEDVQNNNNASSSSSSSSYLLGNFNLNNGIDHNQMVQQQIGETSLEDFLIRAGVINQDQPVMAVDPAAVPPDWLRFQMAAEEQQLESNFNVSETTMYDNNNNSNNPVDVVGYSQLPVTLPAAPSMSATTSSESQAVAASEKKRRCPNEMIEKSIERRQKRMIKNRESAARSRARKQAYTNQLEHEVFNLRQTNSWLKKQKEVEMLLSSDLTPVPRYQLRRTSSALF